MSGFHLIIDHIEMSRYLINQCIFKAKGMFTKITGGELRWIRRCTGQGKLGKFGDRINGCIQSETESRNKIIPVDNVSLVSCAFSIKLT